MAAPPARVSRALSVAVLVNLVVQVGIVVTGGWVRLTGSGLGCPTWPECVPGSYTPVMAQEEGLRAAIEFGNRLLTFVVALAALAVVVLLWRQRRRLVGYGAAVLLGTVLQAVIGGITVLMGLHPATVAVHFLVSALLITVSAVLLLRLREADGPAVPVVPGALRVLLAGLVVTAAATLVIGTLVTGSGPHSGDAEVPIRFDLDFDAVSVLHAESVVLFIGLLLGLLAGLHAVGAPRLALRRTWLLLGITLAQGGLGWLQYFTGLPRPLVSLHMLGACLLVVAVTAVVMATRVRTTPAAVPSDHRSPAGQLVGS
ncbi:COX15/CtaA family protein [Aquipuribacter sp. MA13-6]|uniref:COX15/CtaA family protein n=1 Tax=unclassified Aquipuribacter TaxID=2635084 RepID=UPI003EEEB9C1